jgi:monoamine oxidase
MTATRALHGAGIGFQLIEARDHLGGRILSVDAMESGVGAFELGPS